MVYGSFLNSLVQSVYSCRPHGPAGVLPKRGLRCRDHVLALLERIELTGRADCLDVRIFPFRSNNGEGQFRTQLRGNP